ncbi:hypothetical protein MBAV_002833 [Candidatus Magnetobacterium bavaricum]|uniref:Uncharacterized protein n=1 Tax=Candidatus Magnetobacterium bavaricum TaxID=29290 RepID=A0A0F3GT09_9BACT|nr:hypothetical protein MBAV_002833 [Candidatus Magnetobacterium bavaricum]
MRDWLWLEDQPGTVGDMGLYLTKIGIRYNSYQTPNELINFLCKIKKEEVPDILNNYGLILDVLLMGNRYITCPPEWSGGQKTNFFPTDKSGYDGGIAFYERIILGMGIKDSPIWNPPPPVLFLTVLKQGDENIEQRVETIKEKWAIAACDGFIDRAKVAWLGKWDANEKKLREIFKGWGEI